MFLLVLFLALLITAVPVAFLSLGTFMKLFGFFEIEDPWTLDNWQHVLNDPTLIRSLKNTLSLAFWTAAFLVVLGSLVAYIITKTHFRVRAILDFISWLPWAIPGILVGMALLLTFLLVNRIIPLYGTMSALVISMVISGVPLSVQVIKSFLMQLGDELEEAARISGASWFYTYVHVLLPLLFPCLVIVGLLGFIAAARNISTVVLLATAQTRTVSLLMLDFTAGGELEKATVVAVIIVVIVVIAALSARALGGQISIRG